MPDVREHKGRSLLIAPRDYTVVDIETCGLSPDTCEIIEIAALRVRQDRVTDSFATFVHPRRPISPFITGLTGITNAMVKGAPPIEQAVAAFAAFAGEDRLMGHNVHFDVNILYDNRLHWCGQPLRNDFVDVLRLARRALPQLPSRSQTAVAAHYGLTVDGAHRALRDCEICKAVYERLRREPALAALPEG